MNISSGIYAPVHQVLYVGDGSNSVSSSLIGGYGRSESQLMSVSGTPEKSSAALVVSSWRTNLQREFAPYAVNNVEIDGPIVTLRDRSRDRNR